jgi:hypothetical protein
MKKIIAILLVISISLMIFGCTQAEETTETDDLPIDVPEIPTEDDLEDINLPEEIIDELDDTLIDEDDDLDFEETM